MADAEPKDGGDRARDPARAVRLRIPVWKGGVTLRRESVYSKALAIFVLLSMVLGLGVVYLTQAIIAREFRRTEARETGMSVRRLVMVLEGELERMEAMLGENPAGGLPDADGRALHFYQVDFIGVFEAGGAPVRWVAAEGVPPDLQGHVASFVRSARAGDSGGRRDPASGFAMAGGSLLLLAWVPVGEDPGTLLVAGRRIAGKRLAFLEEMFSGSIDFAMLGGTVIGPPGTEGLLALLTGEEAVVAEPTEETITGMALLREANGAAFATIQLTQGRPLEQSGRQAVHVFLTVLVLAGGLLFVTIWFLLDRTILTRIRELTHEVETCQTRGQLPVKLNFGGGDELGLLARRIEGLAVLLERTRSQYREVVDDQTEIICRFDEEFRITFANDVFRRSFAESGEPPVSLRKALPSDCHTLLIKRFERLYATAPIDTFQHPVAIKPGYILWFRSTLRRSFSRDNKPAGGQWVAADVTAQVLAEQSVQQSEKRLRMLSARLMSLQDEERRRLARELHDSTAQSLSALEMNVSLLDPLARDARTSRLVRETREIARHCCQELRNISYLLHPPLLDEVGMAFAIRWFVDGFQTRTGIRTELEIPETLPRLSPDIETALFRVVQEATTNIYRHSGASTATIRIWMNEFRDLEMVVADNGHGFDPPAAGGEPVIPGIGLAGMRERIAHFDGTISVKSSPAGVTIHVVLPASALHEA
jgi:signal transduction histidine kinase